MSLGYLVLKLGKIDVDKVTSYKDYGRGVHRFEPIQRTR